MQTVNVEPISPLRNFIVAMTKLVEKESDETILLSHAKRHLKTLISTDTWLPEFCTVPHPDYYQQYLLHADPLERFSVVSFVWGPGQKTPIHDHTVWGLIGMLRGAEIGQRYAHDADGKVVAIGSEAILNQGDIEVVSPTLGDIHLVKNAYDDKTSISVHVYGANIGAVTRHVYEKDSNSVKQFVSGYSSPLIPNLWDRSASIRANLN
jgi:predicted metal-dependent enzyme (double-stranded beta helix superfamily)